MIRFSRALKDRFPKLRLDELEALAEQAQLLKLDVIRAADFSPVAKAPHKARTILQVALRRNLELSDSFVSSFNADLFVPLFVVSRSILETGCLAQDVYSRVERVLTDGIATALPDLDRHLQSVLLGSKSAHWVGDPQKYQAPNVLTILDRLTKSLYPDLRKHYDMISEFAHPNYSGMLAAYAENDIESRSTLFFDHPIDRDSDILNIALGAAGVGLSMAANSADGYEKVLADFTALCEREIYDGGTWPLDVPFPRS